MSRITTNTLISLPIVAMLIGGLLWMTDISAVGKANRTQIKDQKELTMLIYGESKDIRERLYKIDERLSRIEGSLDK